MSKHMDRIIEKVIGILTEEVEIGTNVKLNPIYIADRRDEIEFRLWTKRIIHSILNRDIDERQQLGINKKRLEIMDTIEFEITLQERVEELKMKLKDCNNLRESDFLINEIDTLRHLATVINSTHYEFVKLLI